MVDKYKESHHEYYLKNKERIKKRVRDYKRSRIKEVNLKAREYRERNKEIINLKQKDRYKKNKEKYLAYQKWYRETYPEKRSLSDKKSYYKNQDKRLKYSHDWYHNNKDKVKKRSMLPEVKERKRINNKKYYSKSKNKIFSYMLNRKKTDLEYRLISILRKKLGSVFKNYIKTKKIFSSKEYGIDYEAIIKKLIYTFPSDFYERKYHIDHIKPLCSFKFINEDGSTNFEEIKKAFAPENHQWLTAEENNKKRLVDGSMEIGVKKWLKRFKDKNGKKT